MVALRLAASKAAPGNDKAFGLCMAAVVRVGRSLES